MLRALKAAHPTLSVLSLPRHLDPGLLSPNSKGPIKSHMAPTSGQVRSGRTSGEQGKPLLCSWGNCARAAPGVQWLQRVLTP